MTVDLDAYLRPRLTPRNLDRFLVRKSLADAVRGVRSRLSGVLLDIGCGYMPYRELLLAPPSRVTKYVGLDLAAHPNYPISPDLVWDGMTIPLPDESVDSAMATEVLEHCPEPDLVLREIHRVLRPGGVLFLTVPFLWPLHDAPYDHYRYTPFALERMLKSSGFEQVEIHARGGWDASLAQMLGLWARRRPMRRPVRAAVSLLLLPVVRLLSLSDRAPRFESNPMVAGLTGIAVRGSAVEGQGRPDRP
jgi:SAM-dependent methyltransferase